MKRIKVFKVLKSNSPRFQKENNFYFSRDGDIINIDTKDWIKTAEQTKETMNFSYEESDEYDVILYGKKEILIKK